MSSTDNIADACSDNDNPPSADDVCTDTVNAEEIKTIDNVIAIVRHRLRLHDEVGAVVDFLYDLIRLKLFPTGSSGDIRVITTWRRCGG